MNQDQLLSLVRQVMTFAGAFVIKKGWTDSANWEIGVGAAVGLASILWSVYHHSPVQQQQRAADLGAPLTNLPDLQAKISKEDKVSTLPNQPPKP